MYEFRHYHRKQRKQNRLKNATQTEYIVIFAALRETKFKFPTLLQKQSTQ